MTHKELEDLIDRLHKLMHDEDGKYMAAWSIAVGNLMNELTSKWILATH